MGSAAEAGVKLFAGRDQETLVYYSREKGCVVFDRSRSGILIRGREENTAVRLCRLESERVLQMQLFLDVSCVEVFLQEGRHVMTGNVYPDPESTGISLFARGGEATLLQLEKFDIAIV
jgi:beta-fructofuranosidase